MTPRLTAAAWQDLCWQAGLSELQAEIFRRRELLGEPVAAIARDRKTTSHAVRQLLHGAWKKLHAHPWTDAEARQVRAALARPLSPGDDWVTCLMEIFHPTRWNPPTPEYDSLGRPVAAHPPLLNRDDYRAICAAGCPK